MMKIRGGGLVLCTPSVPHDFGAHRSDAPYHFVGIRVIRV